MHFYVFEGAHAKQKRAANPDHRTVRCRPRRTRSASGRRSPRCCISTRRRVATTRKKQVDLPQVARARVLLRRRLRRVASVAPETVKISCGGWRHSGEAAEGRHTFSSSLSPHSLSLSLFFRAHATNTQARHKKTIGARPTSRKKEKKHALFMTRYDSLFSSNHST